ncbi:hypothetical protein GCM10018791_46170 [Streptomyces zaomyceticus]|nr:hypothetical protein GCM10018791_46170 [Streptomyces zaomyceticus]
MATHFTHQGIPARISCTAIVPTSLSKIRSAHSAPNTFKARGREGRTGALRPPLSPDPPPRGFDRRTPSAAPIPGSTSHVRKPSWASDRPPDSGGALPDRSSRGRRSPPQLSGGEKTTITRRSSLMWWNLCSTPAGT